MHAGTRKMGRGGGGAGKKTITAPSINRAVSTVRLSMGGGVRGRGGGRASSAAISSPTGSFQVEEIFSLIRENPLNFGIAVRLAPDLVDDIKRVEAQGGTARIKFDANSKNPIGNVIHAGDKSFRFTWSKEPGDLCDVYEEFRSGEDGNGLLSESGGTWRKLNVERELDDSTKNHVKRLSEEAERKLKSRKAIVLDHQNPFMKKQIKAVAAVSKSWRGFKARKEPPFKKLKSEGPAGGFLLSVPKSGLSATPISKGNLLFGSPLPSQQEQHGSQASPSGYGHVFRGHAGATEALLSQTTKKIGSENDTHSRPPSGTAGEKFKRSCNTEAKPSDLRSLVISLLLGHQDKGMTLKDLEKALGDPATNSARKIEYILKQIALCQASGKYVLKPGPEIEFLNKQPFQSQSPKEINHQAPELEKLSKPSSQDLSSVMGAAAKNEQKYELSVTPVQTIDDVEKVDILSNSPKHSNEKNISINSDGMTGSSSDSKSHSGSESDSSDSDSESGSHSRSKNRSPHHSCSRSSTHTPSDASVSSKQASDEDVDIMTSDDDKESLCRLQDSGIAAVKSTIHFGGYGKHDGMPDVQKDFSQEGGGGCERQATNYSFHNEDDEGPVGISLASESKRKIDVTDCEEKNRDRKRLKSRNSSHPVSGTLNSIFGYSPSNSSPETPDKGITRNGISIVQSVPFPIIPNSRISDAQQGVLRSSEACVFSETSSERSPSKNETSVYAAKYPQKTVQAAARNIKEASSQQGHSSRNNNKNTGRSLVMDDHHNPLGRELSDPELGELRETLYGETTVDMVPFVRSFSKQLESRPMDSEYQNSDLNQTKPCDKLATSVRKRSSQNQEKECFKIADAASKRKTTDHIAHDERSHYKGSQPQHLQHHYLGDFAEVEGQHAKDPEIKSKAKYVEAGISKFGTMKAHGEAASKVFNDSVGIAGSDITKGIIKQIPVIEGQSNGKLKSPSRISKGSKKKRPQSNGKSKASSLKGSNKGGSESKESLDEITPMYIKYEKEEPELKGPIKDASQYENYIKEYQEKYERYSSLSKTLESYRNKFDKLGKELEASKDRDTKRYLDTLKRITSSYNECGKIHKRMKKIFVVLHEEMNHLKQMIKNFAVSYKKS